MIAQGNPSWRTGGPLLGRTYHTEERSIMAKLTALWEGLNNGRGGTFIRPHPDGNYSYGRWSHSFLGHWHFESLGIASSMSAAREALAAADRAVEARVRTLNRKGKRHA